VLSVLPPPGTTLDHGEAPQVSPDGRRLALVATDASGRTAIYIRQRDSLVARALPDTDDASLPFWSPDSRNLGFFARGQLKTIPISGGSPHAIARAPLPRGGSWSREDVILFSAEPNAGPRRVPAAGGDATPVPVGGAMIGFRSFPIFLPDARHYLFLMISFGNGIATGAMSRHAIPRIQAVELVAEQVAAAELYQKENRGVLDYPGLQITIEDGRNYLMRSDEQFEIITADATHPVNSSSWALFTREFYGLVRQRLASDGVFVQYCSSMLIRLVI